MRVLVCGGRNFDDARGLSSILDHIHAATPITVVIDGGAGGADTLAYDWAWRNRIPGLRFSANWAEHGKAAGPIRNRQMLDEGHPDVVIAFPGGRGTENMVKQATEAGVRVLRAHSAPNENGRIELQLEAK